MTLTIQYEEGEREEEECRRTFGGYSPIELCIYIPFLDGEEDEADV